MATSKKKSVQADEPEQDAGSVKFEEGMSQLEEMVRRLEAGSVPLEESLATFEKGIALVRVLQRKLDSVQEKIEELTRNEHGDLETRPLDVEQD